MSGQGLVTLHYRISLEDGTEVISTFGGNPATLALGRGELTVGLERCVAAVEAGQRSQFALEPAEAFGEYRPELLQRYPRTAFPHTMEVEQGVVIEFSGPDGNSHAGLVRGVEGEDVRMDFNHPLAGKRVRFEVEVLAVL